MSLPDLTHKESQDKGILARIDKYIPSPCNFNGQGTSVKIPIIKGKPLIDGPNKGQKDRKVS